MPHFFLLNLEKCECIKSIQGYKKIKSAFHDPSLSPILSSKLQLRVFTLWSIDTAC